MSTHRPPDAPEFATVLRGYDTAQVDDYVATITEWLTEMTERARTAEARATTEAEQRERLQSQLAELEHRLSRTRPEERGAQDNQQEAARIIAEAEREADALRQEAVRDIEQLRATRGVLLRDLERLGRSTADTR